LSLNKLDRVQLIPYFDFQRYKCHHFIIPQNDSNINLINETVVCFFEWDCDGECNSVLICRLVWGCFAWLKNYVLTFCSIEELLWSRWLFLEDNFLKYIKRLDFKLMPMDTTLWRLCCFSSLVMLTSSHCENNFPFF